MAYDPDFHRRRVKEHAARFAAQKREAETKRHNRKMERLHEQQLTMRKVNSDPRKQRVPSQPRAGTDSWGKIREIFEMTLGAAVLICVIYTAYSIYIWFRS